MTIAIALLIIAAAVALLVRRAEVRLVLLGAGLLLATIAGRPLAVADGFALAMVAPMVAPICASMGFAAVLAATGCDRHLVRLLVAPLRRARWAVLPGTILAAYLVNLAVPSQSSTAAALGPILVPLLVAAGSRPAVAGAALVLGASFGGDLLSPVAQDVLALAGPLRLAPEEIGGRVSPSSLAGVLVATLAFSLRHRRSRAAPADRGDASPEAPAPASDTAPAPEPALDPLRALIPLVPIALLLVAYSGWPPLGWLLRPPPRSRGRRWPSRCRWSAPCSSARCWPPSWAVAGSRGSPGACSRGWGRPTATSSR
jgi:DcuC family C4-dicarboxylate transporter